MAKIPLRVYVKEIENLIDRGEIEQAVAHAKNILKSYPKSIDTYRLLGKAYLESQRYTEAADILQRVLSVIPDDFVSQIGMSIIREDEGDLDAAIWHMERAYEVQPFNPAVQDELRRLYGRRDGVEPPKIRLTRGALVRMYTRGELYPQAIAETRAALADDPQRVDLRVLLARLYFLSGHKNDAAEVSSELLSKLPYCLEANRLLTEILPSTSRAEEAKKFQQRIYALDPYEAFISPSAPTSDQVPDQSVMVDQFTWDASMQGAQPPEWTQSVGIQWEDTEEENLPDWLNTLKPDSTAAPAAATLEPSGSSEDIVGTATDFPAESDTPAADDSGFSFLDEPSAPIDRSATPEISDSPLEMPAGLESAEEDTVPDWMKDAGWIKSDRTADDIMAEQSAAPEADDAISPAEIPDWIQSIAPPEAAQPAQENEDSSTWLDSLLEQSNKARQEETGTAEPMSFASAEDTSFPDWTAETSASAAAASTDSDLPEWFTQAQSEAPDSSAPSSLDLSTTEVEANLTADSTTAAGVEDVPDWLKSFGSEPAQTGETPAADQPDEWLSAVSQPEPLESEAPAEDIDTGWLSMLAATADENEPAVPSEAQLPSAEAQAANTVETPLDETQTSPAVPDLSNTDSMMAWLESLAARQGADEATLITPADQRTDTPPDWVVKEIENQPADTLPSEPGAESLDDHLVSDAQAIETPDEAPQPELADANDFEAQLKTETALVADSDSVEIPSTEDNGGLPEWLKDEVDNIQADTITSDVENSAVEPTQPIKVIHPSAEITSEAEPEPMATATEEAAVPTAGVPDYNDTDAMMAWLESLAAKQGADEATLITPPDQRTETPPDWVIKEVEASAENPVEAEAVDNAQPILSAEAQNDSLTAAEAEEIRAGVIDENEAQVNLDNKDAIVSSTPDTVQETIEPAVEADIPDWLKDTLPVESTALDLPELSTQIDPEIETRSPAEAAVESSSPAQPEPSAEGEADLDFAWLESLAARQGADEGTLITAPEDRLETPPTWVHDEKTVEVEFPTESAESSPVEGELDLEAALSSLTDQSTDVDPEPSSNQAEPAEQTNQWASELETPSQPVEQMPGLESDLPDWLKQMENEEQQPGADLSTSIMPDWLQEPADEAESEIHSDQPDVIPAVPEEIHSAWVAEIAPEDEKRASTVSLPLSQSPIGANLKDLQSALQRGDLDRALEGYGQFIHSGVNLDETIRDLKDALYRYPVDISIWQALGDAYARNDQLQDALDAYTKAEELLK